ncbi:hypothetical protein RAD16_24695 [Bradyrhizobium sp. 18BD]
MNELQRHRNNKVNPPADALAIPRSGGASSFVKVWRVAGRADTGCLKRDEIKMNRHRASGRCVSMISA